MVRVERHEKVPEAKAEIALPIAKIQTLPQGLDFQQRKGRATAGVRVEHDTIFFTAHCDSLQQLVERYEAVIAGKESEVEAGKVKEKDRESWGWGLVIMAVVVLLVGYRK